jgi:hypothetical protein
VLEARLVAHEDRAQRTEDEAQAAKARAQAAETRAEAAETRAEAAETEAQAAKARAQVRQPATAQDKWTCLAGQSPYVRPAGHVSPACVTTRGLTRLPLPTHCRWLKSGQPGQPGS